MLGLSNCLFLNTFYCTDTDYQKDEILFTIRLIFILFDNVSELSFVRMTINEIPGQFGGFTVPKRGEVQ